MNRGLPLQKRLEDHEFNELMNDWLDSDTRSRVERAAWHRDRLGNAQHAALAAEHATRRYRQMRWTVPLFVLQLVLAVTTYVLRDDPSGWDAGRVALGLVAAGAAFGFGFAYYRGARFHEPNADFDRLRDTARIRRARAGQPS